MVNKSRHTFQKHKNEKGSFKWQSLIWVVALALGAIPVDVGAIPPDAKLSEEQSISPFTDEAVGRGVVYVMQDYPQAQGHLGFGCGFADLDRDGDEDIVIMGAADGHVGLFENDGTGNFTDRSAGSGIPLLTEETGFVSFDYDNDGDLDLYFTRIGEPNILLRNDGNFQFTDVTAIAGVGDVGSGESASAADFDGDGWLDFYVCNYNGLAPLTDNINNRLYLNRGNGSFNDVSVAQTVNDFGLSFQSVWSDIDRDCDVDLYLSNDRAILAPFRSNQLWRNDNGQLVNISVGSGADISIFSMGIAAGDFDGNSLPDFYCTNVDSPDYSGINPLLLNQGNGTFVESSAQAGVDHYITSWGSIFFDFNNDTRMDLYVNNMFQPNSLYDCSASFPCVDVSSVAQVTGSRVHSFSSAVADVDNDGDLDLLQNNLGGNVELFINHEGEKRNWIRYRLVGQRENQFAVGGNIDTRVGNTWQFREIYAGGNGYLGQNELTVHVGLDNATVADEVVVNWPGCAATRTLTNLPANHTWMIYPPEKLGDANYDDTVNFEDYVVFIGCVRSHFQPGCEIMDFNGDSTIDKFDFSKFLGVYSPSAGGPR